MHHIVSNILEILSEVPAAAWIGLAGVLVGSALSVFGVWLSNSSRAKQLKIQLEHEKSIKHGALKREKLEELYVLIGKWVNNLFAEGMHLVLVMREEMDYNQYLDKIIQDGENNTVDFDRLSMIVKIYGHELQESYKRIMQARDEINKISSAHKRAYKSGETDGYIFINPYTSAQLKISELVESFREEIADCAKNA